MKMNYWMAAILAAVALLLVFAFDASAATLMAPIAATTLDDIAEGFVIARKKFEDSDNALNGRMADIEQKLVRRGGDGFRSQSTKSIGEQFAESPEFKNLAQLERGKATMSIKSTITLADASAGSLVNAERLPGVTDLAKRRLTFRHVLAQGQTNSSSVEFVKQKTRTNTAGTVPETNAKPEAVIEYELKNAPVRTIAVTVPASRQVLSDAPMLQSMIDTELRYMLSVEEEQQLLNGNGLGSNMLGIIPQATAFVAPFAIATPTMIDTLLLAIAQNEAANFETDFIGLNPLDWRRIQSLKDADGRYLANGPFNADQVARLWSTPIVSTQAIQVDKFLVGDGKRGAQVFDRWQARVEVSTEHADFFVRNMVMVLAEERLALAVYQPAAFVYGDFGNVA